MILTGLLFLLLGGFTFSSELPPDQQGLNQTTVTQEEDCYHCSGEEYRGYHSTTEGGLTCRHWDTQRSYKHKYNPSNYPQHALEENYCRNPRGDSRPWCYTSSSDERSEYCTVPRCKHEPSPINYEMDCINDRGKEYRGTISVTWSGKRCQKWSAQTPHCHVNYTPEKMPCGDLIENYCRNPDNDTKPWCYTTDPSTMWEYCNVPSCDNSESNCTEQDVLNFLNLTSNNDRFTMGRPVKHHKNSVQVHLKMVINAVLDVSEIEQTLNLHIWTYMGWINQHVKWNKSDFCNLSNISVPAQSLWKPDIIITEQIERSKNSPSPYVTIMSHGAVSWLNEEVVVTNCKMRVYRFPFDTQSCNITFKSQSYDDYQLQIADSKETNESQKMFQTQDEWVFKDITCTKGTAENIKKQMTLVFTITMQRWSALYIANLLLPVLFFLSLDLASFLISNTGGEKLSFKITTLLAVTVMQLLLNDILPGSSDKIPLIAIFCIGIFTLMLLSVLETILVMNLIDRDASSQEKETEQRMVKNRGTKLFCFSLSKDDDSAGKTPFVVNELFRDQQPDESINLKMVLEELKEVLLNHRKEEEKEGYWTKMAKRIDKIFTVFYLSSVVLFLLVMCSLWTGDD